MSRIKELRENEQNKGNVIKVIEQILGPETKTKYAELLLEIAKNENVYTKAIRNYATNKYNIDTSELNNFECVILKLFFSVILDDGKFEIFKKFIEYNENNQIKNNDLTKIKDIKTIIDEVSVADLKNITKDMSSQVVVLFEDEEWLVLKPITIMASRKYGYNTKWCTTSQDSYSYFLDYGGRGILIYSLNKKTGYKVATFKSLKSDEYSFWNQQDRQISPLDSELTDNILSIIRKECRNCKVNNRALLTKEDAEKEYKLFDLYEKKLYPSDGVPLEVLGANRGGIRVRDAEEEMTMGAENEIYAPDDDMLDQPMMVREFRDISEFSNSGNYGTIGVSFSNDLGMDESAG